MRGLGSFRVGNGSNGDESSPRMSRLGMSHLPQIPEIGIENGKEMNTAGFSLPSWNDSNADASHLSEVKYFFDAAVFFIVVCIAACSDV